MMRVWLHIIGGKDCTYDTVRRVLETAGIVTAPVTDTPHVFGIVLFHHVCPQLYAFLDTHCTGVERVLALSLSEDIASHDNAWRLLQAGASDVLVWNREPDHLISRLRRWEAVDRMLSSPLVQNTIVGASAIWLKTLRQIVEVAAFTDSSMLVMGETGTGKELVARLVHTIDTRADKGELVLADCSTIVPDLSGSEFFGHERGAFTGAAAARDGAFALANGGTLFLDEVGELPLALQAQLLRVIQEGTYKRVGGNHWQRTQFRLVCATNKDLRDEVRQGRFRADLYYRISRWTCRLPSLAERQEDIPALIRHFIAESWEGETPPELSDVVRQYLLRREYPGNVRDLKQLVARILDRHVGDGPITVGDIPVEERPSLNVPGDSWNGAHLERVIREAIVYGATLKEISRRTSETAIRIAVDQEGGSLQRAARRLGVTDRALQLRRANHRQHHDEESTATGG